ncbi:hypothetical protein NDU88_001906 [Pleurodeles waltl]|uniref:Uncharacterized protein n=1 Tax=Pleurodeles waltl TaxID=8319 RepID=A0AAV7P858_PLEWA|nr:hypothetical protein NDU88_001906 [Pleurodeles waltl]
MVGTGRLRSGAGAGRSQDSVVQDSQKLDAVLAPVECIGDSLERACTSLEAKIENLASDLVLLYADHRKLVDKTGEIEVKVDELTPTASRLKSEMEGVQARMRSRASRVRRGGELRAGPVACAPDLEQLMQERREAIHSAAAISASPLASESDTELSQPPSDRPVTPDCLSELGLVGGPPATPDELLRDARVELENCTLLELSIWLVVYAGLSLV